MPYVIMQYLISSNFFCSLFFRYSCRDTFLNQCQGRKMISNDNLSLNKETVSDNQTQTSKCQAHFSPKHLIFGLPLLLHDKQNEIPWKKKALLENFYACGYVNISTLKILYLPPSFSTLALLAVTIRPDKTVSKKHVPWLFASSEIYI